MTDERCGAAEGLLDPSIVVSLRITGTSGKGARAVTPAQRVCLDDTNVVGIARQLDECVKAIDDELEAHRMGRVAEYDPSRSLRSSRRRSPTRLTWA